MKQNPMWSWVFFSHMKKIPNTQKTPIRAEREVRSLKRRNMRQREILVEFRTPQHPALGTNQWGGASPLLARNIPEESLEQRYLRLNSIRTRDEVFPAKEDDFKYLSQTRAPKRHEPAPTPRRSSIGFLSKLTAARKEKVVLGSNSKKKRWFPRWDPQHRWPQGWC